MDDNSKLRNTIEHYRRVRKYRKEKLNDISKQLEEFVCSLKGFRVWESRLANECGCHKELWNIDWLENIEEKNLRRASFLIDLVY